uniref:hypothetical protein n=1 Tax=Wolbachia pipientis TaxID=955 RepID=UPI002553CCDA|nr:hypothetical protein [Wolbachia pipientis]
MRYRAQLYEHSFLKVNCTANGVIPVLDTGMTPSTTQITCKLQCSYTKRMNRGMTVRGGMT